MPPARSPFAIKQTNSVWMQARRWTATAVTILLVFLAILIIWLANVHDNRAGTATSSTPTPSPTATVTPETLSVTYLIAVESDEWSSVTVDLWYSSGIDQRKQERGRRILDSDPYIIELQMPPGTFVELFAALQNNSSGNLTCRIVAANVVIQERSSRGQGAGVYCGGPVVP